MAGNLNFVKFQRGTQAQYDRLKLANRLESDALYFIYDSANPQDGGLLYLGDVLIGGTGSAVGASALNDLSDVNLSGVTLSDGMILQYNNTAHTWEPVAASNFLPSVESGQKQNAETAVQALNRIDATPLEGDIVFVDNTPYIYDGSNWQLLVGQALEDRVSALETAVDDLEDAVDDIDSKIATAVAQANHLSYQVVGQLPQVANASENVVYLVGDGTAVGNDKYEEYMFVNNNFEKVGTFGAELNNYVTTSQLQTAVDNLEDAISDLQDNLGDYVLLSTYNAQIGDIADLHAVTGDNTDTIVDALSDVYDRLIWHEIPSVT